ncbi:unnamed protein product [Leptidea sinapis]|uniref:SCP domain-containing protein n=1 Tax=Leptidea sinapis TaxID=189913 RepID=A0A5E4QU04_9NEOP|nr:unnamed protein product [Leptidea sinapis]
MKCTLGGQSCDEIKDFVDGHNDRRLQLAKGEVPKQPAAALMNSVIWDEALAAKAQNWASEHESGHNPNRTDGLNRFFIGENIYTFSTKDKTYKLDPKTALDYWFNENKNYTYGPLRRKDFRSKMIGEYTQMVWSDSVYLGCGISSVTKDGLLRYYVVCYYGPVGNHIGETPYEKGSPSNKLTCAVGNCAKPYGDSC